MFLDKKLEFDPASTAITVTADSTNVVDLGVGRDLGVGDSPALKILVLVQESFDAAGAGTLTVAVTGAPDNGAGAEGAYTVIVQTPAIGKASLKAGSKLLDIDLPRQAPNTAGGQLKPMRFLKLVYTVATGPMTSGKVQAGILTGNEAAVQYPSGFTVTN